MGCSASKKKIMAKHHKFSTHLSTLPIKLHPHCGYVHGQLKVSSQSGISVGYSRWKALRQPSAVLFGLQDHHKFNRLHSFCQKFSRGITAINWPPFCLIVTFRTNRCIEIQANNLTLVLRRQVENIYTLLGCYAACDGNSLPTFRYNLSSRNFCK